MAKLTLFVLALLAMAFPARADDQTLKLGGRLETYGATYLYKSQIKENLFGEVRFLPTADFIAADYMTLHVEGDFRLDSNHLAKGTIDSLSENDQRWNINIREAYEELRFDNVRLRTGKQIFEWGVTDTVSPSDNLNPRDWQDFIKAREKIGIPAISLKNSGETYFEAVMAPIFTPSKLPQDGTRWFTDLPIGVFMTKHEPVSAIVPQVAIRLGTNVLNTDLGASFFSGFSYSPTYKLTPTSATTANLSAVYNSENVYALSVAKSLANYNLRMELGYFNQKNADDFLQVVFGIDREWSNVITETDSFYLLFQYSDSFTTRSTVSIPGTFDLRRVLDKSFMTKFRYSPDDSNRWSINVEGSFNHANHDWYAQPSITRKIAGNTEIKVGYDVMGGPKDSFFGGYRKNNRIFTSINLFF